MQGSYALMTATMRAMQIIKHLSDLCRVGDVDSVHHNQLLLRNIDAHEVVMDLIQRMFLAVHAVVAMSVQPAVPLGNGLC